MLFVTSAISRFSRASSLVLLLWLGSRIVAAQTVSTLNLRVEGPVLPPRTLTPTDLKALRRVEQSAPDKQGKQHTYSGVALVDILQLVGAPLGKDLHGKTLADVLLVSAADGYQVAFALPELDPAFTTQTILLADRCDGQPLPTTVGPYQVIVPLEKKPARWIRQVTALRVVSAQP